MNTKERIKPKIKSDYKERKKLRNRLAWIRKRNKIIETEFLYNHKSIFNNERDLFIYKNLVPGKYLNDPLNKIALSKVKYGVTEDDEGNKKLNNFQDKYFKLDYESVSKTICSRGIFSTISFWCFCLNSGLAKDIKKPFSIAFLTVV